MFDDENAARNLQMNLAQYRCYLLRSFVSPAATEVTADKCTGWYQLMMTYLPKCSAKESIQG